MISIHHGLKGLRGKNDLKVDTTSTQDMTFISFQKALRYIKTMNYISYLISLLSSLRSNGGQAMSNVNSSKVVLCTLFYNLIILIDKPS